MRVAKQLLSTILMILERYSSWGNVLVFFIITQVFYGLILGVTIPSVMEYSGGMKLLDMMPMGYNAEYVRLLLDTLGEEGRRLYVTNQIPVDMVYPGLFAVSYSLLLTFTFKKNFWLHGMTQYLTLVPVLAGSFDYLENTGIVIMISIYPTFISAVADVINVFSVLKSFFATLSFMTLITSLIVLFFGVITRMVKSRG